MKNRKTVKIMTNSFWNSLMRRQCGIFLVVLNVLMLQGCDSGGKMLDSEKDTAPLIPQVPPTEDPNRPRPPGDALVIVTDSDQILDAEGEPILARGISLQYGEDPVVRYDSIEAIQAAGSNIVRIDVTPDTTATLLEAALNKVVDEGMVAMVTLVDEARLVCAEDEDTIFDAVEKLWLGAWLPVLAQERFQPYLMINIANKWGPQNVFVESTISYSAYIDTYKNLIRRFRSAGFRVPLVIDAPGCGHDFFAFLGGRTRELMAVDSEENIVLSVHAFERYWNSSSKLRANFTSLQNLSAPFIVTEFGGSDLGGDNAVDHSHLLTTAIGDQALALDLPWETAEDKVAYSYTLPLSVDLTTGAIISFDAYLPRAYVDDGKLGLQLYLRDEEGRYGAVKFETAAQKLFDQWNTFRYEITSLTDVGGWKDAGFNLANISKIGIEVIANGKPVGVAGQLKFDNFRIDMTSPPEPEFHADFAVDNNGFVRDWGAGEGESSAVTQGDGELLIAPTWGAGNSSIGVAYDNQVSKYIDLAKPFTLSVDIFVPEEYADEMLEFQFFVKDSTWKFAAVGYWGDSDIPVGETKPLRFVMEDISASSGYKDQGFAGVGTPNAIGFEIKGISSAKTAPIRLDNFKIFVPAETAPGVVFFADFATDSENFVRDWGAGENDPSSVTQENGQLRVLPPWGMGETSIAVARDNQVDQHIDLTKPFSMSVDLYIPQEYEGENIEFQFFVKDSTWKYAQVGYWNSSALPVGQVHPIKIDVTDIVELPGYQDPGFSAVGAPNSFGMEIKGISSAKSQPIMLDNFTIALPVEDTEAVTALDLHFEDAAEINEFSLDYFEGAGWMESTLGEAKQQVMGINPFGWIAWSWFGNAPENQAWDLSNVIGFTNESELDLTQRGIEIITGPNGIMETASPVNFPVSEE